jgi:hypothetical protein
MGTDELVVFSFPNETEPAQGSSEESITRTIPVAPPVPKRKIRALNELNINHGVGKMDVMKMLAELKQEREHIEEAILTLERLARGRGKRRGRPPSWMKELKRRGRPPGSKNKSKETSGS